MKIVQIGDLHGESWRAETGKVRLASRASGPLPLLESMPTLGPFFSRLRERAPDLILFTGDAADGTPTAKPGAAPNSIAICDEISRFAQAPVAFVPGNHEFYRGAPLQRQRFELARHAAQSNGRIILLDGLRDEEVRPEFSGAGRLSQRIRVGGLTVDLAGATLWTDFALFGIRHRLHAMRFAHRGSSAHDRIRLWRTALHSVGLDQIDERAFEAIIDELGFRREQDIITTVDAPLSKCDPLDLFILNRLQRAALIDAFARRTDKQDVPLIVLSHYPPMLDVGDLHFDWEGRLRLLPSMASDINDDEDLVAASGAALWACGHAHNRRLISVDGTKSNFSGDPTIVSNWAIGFRHEHAAEDVADLPGGREFVLRNDGKPRISWSDNEQGARLSRELFTRAVERLEAISRGRAAPAS